MDADDMFNDVRKKKRQVDEIRITAAQLRHEGLTDKAIELETEAKLLQSEALRKERDAIYRKSEERRAQRDQNIQQT